MARWSYSGDPSNNDKDAIRFLIGDTIQKRPLVMDEEIAWALSEFVDRFIAAAVVCEAISGRYAREADASVGDVSKSFSQISGAYRDRAKELRQQAMDSVVPFFGGLTVSGKRELDLREDDVQPQFAIGDFDSPLTISERDFASRYFIGR